MRIVHANLARGWRGGERQTLLLMQGLKALGHENVLIARRGEALAARAAEAGFPTIDVARPFAWRCRRLPRGDLWQIHETQALQFAAIRRIARSSPIVLTRRVDYPPKSNPFTRWAYRAADHVVSVSHFVDRVLADWGVESARRSVIHDAALNEQPDEHAVHSLRRRFQGRRVIGCVAALVMEHKDQLTLLRAMSIVNRTHEDLVLVLVGEGRDRGRLEREIAERGLNNVSLEGFQNSPASYLSVFDVFALTSRVEGLGSVLLEAFAAKVPVVATNAGGIPELVKHNQTGWLAPVGDAERIAEGILRMLDDAPFARSCAERACERYRRHHTPEAMACRYESLYRSLSKTPR